MFFSFGTPVCFEPSKLPHFYYAHVLDKIYLIYAWYKHFIFIVDFRDRDGDNRGKYADNRGEYADNRGEYADNRVEYVDNRGEDVDSSPAGLFE